MYIRNISSSVQLEISQVCCTFLRDINLNTRRESPYLQATMYYFVYYKVIPRSVSHMLLVILITTFFFQIYWDFQPISEIFLSVSKNCLKATQMFQNIFWRLSWKIWRCFAHTPTNLSIVYRVKHDISEVISSLVRIWRKTPQSWMWFCITVLFQ